MKPVGLGKDSGTQNYQSMMEFDPIPDLGITPTRFTGARLDHGRVVGDVMLRAA